MEHVAYGAVSEPVWRVAIDVTSLIGERTGVGHVTAGFVDHLAAPTTCRSWRTPSPAMPRSRRRRGSHPGSRSASRACPRACSSPRGGRPRSPGSSGGPDRSTSCTARTSSFRPPRARGLVTIHDVAFLRDPHLVSPASRRFAGLLRAALRRGATVHVYSDTVGVDLQHLLPCPADRVVRIYPGIAATGDGDAAAGRALAGADRYVLALGTVEPRKNLPRLVAAFDIEADARRRAPPGGCRSRRLGHRRVPGRSAGREPRRSHHPARLRRRLRPRRSPRRRARARVPVARRRLRPSSAGGDARRSSRRRGAGRRAPRGARRRRAPRRLRRRSRRSPMRSMPRTPTTRQRARLAAAGHERVARYTWERATDELVASYRRLAGRG